MTKAQVNDVKAENSSYEIGKVELRHQPDDARENTTETNGVLKVQKRGDPNKSGLPDVDLVKRPGVKSLVSAFNEQIESHKVLEKYLDSYNIKYSIISNIIVFLVTFN